MSLHEQIKNAIDDPAALENLYRKSQNDKSTALFSRTISEIAQEYPNNQLLQAWQYRLDIEPVSFEEQASQKVKKASQHWIRAIIISLLLGVVFLLLVEDKPPMPVPKISSFPFWFGWSPITALFILAFLIRDDSRKEQLRFYTLAGIIIVIAAALGLWANTGTDPQTAGLVAIHLPFLSWIALGSSGFFGQGNNNISQNFYGYILKSFETLITAGIYLIAGIIFFILTSGIFSILEVSFSEAFWLKISALGLGFIPVLAIATAYEPSAALAEQPWSGGLTKLLKTLTRLFLPLTLFVLALYVFWFIPAYFYRAFEQRDVLIVYNLLIMAVLALITIAIPFGQEEISAYMKKLLRLVISLISGSVFLLNLYAMAAIISRTISGGLTPNRLTVIGWNIVTLIMLGWLLIRLIWPGTADWPEVFQKSLVKAFIFVIAWILILLILMPFLF